MNWRRSVWLPWARPADLPARSRRQSLANILLRLADISFLAAVFFAPFRLRWTLFQLRFPPVYSDYTDGLLFIGDIFLLITLAFWLGSLLLQPRRLSSGIPSLTIPLAGLLLAALNSALFSILPGLSLYHALRLLMYAALYLYVINNAGRLHALIWALAASVAVQAAVGVAQWLGQNDLGWQRLGEYELDPAWSGVSIVWAEAGRSLRAYGLSDHPNILGGMLAFGLALLLSRLISDDHTPAAPTRIVLTSVWLLGLVGLFLTFSRSAWLGFTASVMLGALLLAWKRDVARLTNAAAMVVAGLLILAPFVWRTLPYLGVRFNAAGSFEEVPYERASYMERVMLNGAANELFVQNALNGVGLGAFPVALRSAQPDFPFFYQPPHLVLLAAAAETGLFGALFYSLAILAPWVALWLRRKRLKWSSELIGASALLLAVMLVGFFDYYPWLLAPGRFWQWLAWGLWSAGYTASIDKG